MRIVVGIDTHKLSHTAVALSRMGELLGQTEVETNSTGYGRLLKWAQDFGCDLVFGIEGAGSWGAGLCEFLLEKEMTVFEVEQPKRKVRRRGKSDVEDALIAARKVVSGEGLSEPRSRDTREVLRMLISVRNGFVSERTKTFNRIQAQLAVAPYSLRERIGEGRGEQVARAVLTMRVSASISQLEATALTVMRDLGKHCRQLTKLIDDYEQQIEELVKELNPQMLEMTGVGPISAAELLVSSPERFRTETAFARINGTAPIPASSGQNQRFRLNRGGDRRLNHAIHMIVVSRCNHDPESQEYIAKKLSEGKTKREAIRALKRHTSRRLFRQLQAT